MPYLVRAEIEKPGSGTFRTEAETKTHAIQKAQALRSHGLRVQITDHRGEPVDETILDGPMAPWMLAGVMLTTGVVAAFMLALA